MYKEVNIKKIIEEVVEEKVIDSIDEYIKEVNYEEIVKGLVFDIVDDIDFEDKICERFINWFDVNYRDDIEREVDDLIESSCEIIDFSDYFGVRDI